jgi:uncharacterized protein YcbK (DUF882 family)
MVAVVAIAAPQAPEFAAANDTRTIALYHVHTHENLTITYKKNGHYDDEALKKINWHLRDWRKDQEITMDPQVIDLLWEVHREVGGQEPIHVIGGYRSPATNAMLRRRSKGVAKTSQHMVGKAVDFFIPGVPLDAIRAAGLRLHGGGVGFYPTSGSPFVHMDVGGVRHWPRMTREQLVKIFPEGRTVHVPSDGNPLPGYQLALADIERGQRTVAPQKKRSLIAALFGGAQDQEESEDKAADRQAPAAPKRLAAPKAAATAVAAATAPKPVATHAAPENVQVPIPLPPIRPTFEIASAESRPEPAPVPRPPAPVGPAAMITAALNSNDIIIQRGHWQGVPETAQGSQARAGQPAPDSTSGALRMTAAASKADSAEVASAGSVGPFTRPDRVPPELALAYAAQPGNAAEPPRLASMSSLPVVTPARVTNKGGTSVASKPTETVARSQRALPEHLNDRLNNPWLRGLVLVSSMQHAMTITVLGDPDFRSLVAHMRKPSTSVMMTFSRDPHLGMTAEGFTGSAIVFQATVTFDERRHAALR